MAYFPMFIDITGQNCLVVGGGKVALRKVQVLQDFGAIITVVATDICAEIRAIAAVNDAVFLWDRDFEKHDIEGKMLVVAATDNETVNQRISSLCKAANIPVNVVDDKEKCSFIFPSYIREKNLVGAFSSSGNSPVLATFMKRKMSDILTSQMGELNEILGKRRPEIINKYPDEKERKAVYEKIIEQTLSTGRIPDDLRK